MKKKKNKICIYIPYLGSGGVETSCYNIALGFYNKGYNVSLIINNRDKLVNLNKFDNICDVFILDKSNYFSLISLISVLNKINPDILISGQTPCNLMAALARLFKRSFIHYPIVHISINSQGKGLKKNLSKFFYVLISYLSGHLVSVSKGLESELKSILFINKKSISTIYNALYDSVKIRKPKNKNINSPLNIIASGRFTEQKNFIFLIEVFKKYVSLVPDSKLILLGDGPLKNELEKAVKDNCLCDKVVFAGFVNDVDLYLKDADVFVLTSLYEGFGIVLIDAIKNGIPVVSINCEHGPKEIIESTKYGYLIDDYNVDYFIECFFELNKLEFDENKISDYLRLFTTGCVIENFTR